MTAPSRRSRPRTPDTRALERVVLGGFLTQPALLESVPLELEDFAIPAHREIYAVLRELGARGPFDLTLFLDVAETRGRIEAWGGVVTLGSLPSECVSVVTVPAYAQKLRDHRQRRDVELALRRTLEDLPPAGDDGFAAGLARAIQTLTALGGPGRGETAAAARA